MLSFYYYYATCSSIFYFKEGGYRAKKPQYHCLSPDRDSDMFKLIDTASIYVEKTLYSGWPYIPNYIDEFTEGDTIYKFFRFFSNGKFYTNVKMSNRFPTNEDINFFYQGVIGSYCVKGSSLSIYFFTVSDGGSYETYYGNIYHDSIQFKERRNNIFYLPLKNKFDDPFTIVRIKEPWMKFWAQPAW